MIFKLSKAKLFLTLKLSAAGRVDGPVTKVRQKIVPPMHSSHKAPDDWI